MGMDVYGLNPKIKPGTTKPKMPDFKTLDEEERQEYFESVEKYEADNPGVYFRSNIWWWRPIWQYTCDLMHDVFDDEEIAGGSVNSGYQITADKTAVLADRLGMAIEENAHHMYERDYKYMQKSLPKVKCEICEGKGMRQYERNENITELAPCNACNGTKLQDDWRTKYPFDAETIESFYNFVKNSGGFQIC